MKFVLNFLVHLANAASEVARLMWSSCWITGMIISIAVLVAAFLTFTPETVAMIAVQGGG